MASKEEFLQNNPYFQQGEKAFLQHLILSLPKNPLVLEIGTFRGWSAITMALARKDIRIITLDNLEGIPEENFHISSFEIITNFKNNNVERQITFIKSSSQDFNINKKLDLIFIDGDHSFNGVKHDFKKFLPFVKEKGIVVFHDYRQEPGVTKFCNTLAYNLSQRFNSMLAVRKCDLC